MCGGALKAKPPRETLWDEEGTHPGVRGEHAEGAPEGGVGEADGRELQGDEAVGAEPGSARHGPQGRSVERCGCQRGTGVEVRQE